MEAYIDKENKGYKCQKISFKTGINYKSNFHPITKSTRFVHACDYDQEGEVIGYNILRYACGNKYESSLRAKFSTLTDDEITKFI